MPELTIKDKLLILNFFTFLIKGFLTLASETVFILSYFTSLLTC